MNRNKKLKQQYKETPRKMGVYRVFNRVDGLSLIGYGRDVQAVLNRHQAELKFGGHRNKRLQSDWNRLGSEAFSFDIVELLPPIDKPDYDPEDDLNELLLLPLEGDEYVPEKLYPK